jgi:hypothetical protein
VSQECHKSVTRVSQECHKSVKRGRHSQNEKYIQHEHVHVLTSVQVQQVAEKHRTSRKEAIVHARVFPDRCIYPHPLQGRYKSVTRVLRECYKGVTRVLRECH